MNWRFRKRIKLVPGVHLNLNKGMPSLSVGEGPFTVNFNKNGVRGTVGPRGTGLSLSHQWPWGNKTQRELKLRLLELVEEIEDVNRKVQRGQTDEALLRRTLALTDEFMALAPRIEGRTAEVRCQQAMASMRTTNAACRQQLAELGQSEFDQLGDNSPKVDPWQRQQDSSTRGGYQVEEHDSSLSWNQTLSVLALGCAILVIGAAIFGALPRSGGTKTVLNPSPAAAAKMSEAERKQTEEFWKQSREKEKAEEEKRKQGLDKAAREAREARGYPAP
jgi:Protein of unknown function (DUF4236)